jgi:twinkle protein
MQAAISKDPAELRGAETFVEDVRPETQNRFRLRPAELTVVCGWNGHGKSQFLGHLALDLMRQEQRICIASMELLPAYTLRRMVWQATTLRDPSPAYIRAVHTWLEGKLWLFNVTGNAKADTLLDVFRYARKRYGINVFVVDSLMKCGLAEDDYRAQKQFVEQLCDFKNETGSIVFLVAHPRKAESETIAPGKLDIKGTGAVADLADNVLSVWRNVKKRENLSQFEEIPHDLRHQPDAFITVSKQRNGDWEGSFPLWFDKESCQFLADTAEKPRRFVPFSC